eukprot:GGOE01002743.1.p1 GENE.GGOE01002743.1~~GGOE01002743.1.p1  ORF type:complete len:221 (-),score=53.36 GGOE01002743.1:347-916(-)
MGHHMHFRDTLRSVMGHLRPSRRSHSTREVRFDVYPASPTDATQDEASQFKPIQVEEVTTAREMPSTARCRQLLRCDGSPEAALANLSEKKLLDARAMCLQRLGALKELNRTAQAALRTMQEFDDQDAEVARLEQEVRQREEEIKRWGCRVHVADLELQRRGLLAPLPVNDASGARRKSHDDAQGASGK